MPIVLDHRGRSFIAERSEIGIVTYTFSSLYPLSLSEKRKLYLMANYVNVNDLNLVQKEEHDRYDTLDRTAIDGPDVEEKEGHDRLEDSDSRQTPVAPTNESKRSTDKSMENDYVTLVEKGAGKVPSTLEKRPTSSLIPSRTGKKKEEKKATQLETIDKDEYDSLYRLAMEDLDIERPEGHDRVEGRHSTRHTPAVQSIESKRSPDKAMEIDYMMLVEKGPGKVPSVDDDSRPTSSLIPRTEIKKTVKKKEPHVETTDKDEYDSLYQSAIEDLDIGRLRKEGHDRVEGPQSIRQTPVAQINELKRSQDKEVEWDNGSLVEKRTGKVPSMDADSRPTSSSMSSREGKKKEKKQAEKVETSDQDLHGFDELDRSEAVFSSAQTSIALQPIVKCQKRVEKTWAMKRRLR